jgi:hypothetical protein
MDDYSDIINLSRPVSKRPRMSLEQRSAQFAPFAALTGYEGQVKETARLTDKKIELNEELKEILDSKIQLIREKIKEQPQIEITYFIPDSKKDGGRYETICNAIQKIDMYVNEIIMLDGTRIDIEEIINIQGDLV